jgi:hypothetical protein
MSKIENNDHKDCEQEVLSSEEIDKIVSVEFTSYVKPPVKQTIQPNIWSIFDFLFKKPEVVVNEIIDVKSTQQALKMDIQRRCGLDKVVTITNISGKNAWVILTPSQIKSIKSVGVGVKDINFNIEFEHNGEYKAQELSIPNNTGSEYELDNTKFYFTLLLNIDDKWKITWKNRKFNSTKYDINILERHVAAAYDMDSMPTV